MEKKEEKNVHSRTVHQRHNDCSRGLRVTQWVYTITTCDQPRSTSIDSYEKEKYIPFNEGSSSLDLQPTLTFIRPEFR